MTDQRAGKVHYSVGDASVQHQLARKDEEWNREEREHAHARRHLLEADFERQTFVGQSSQCRQANRKRHGHTQQQQESKGDAQNQ